MGRLDHISGAALEAQHGAVERECCLAIDHLMNALDHLDEGSANAGFIKRSISALASVLDDMSGGGRGAAQALPAALSSP